MNSTHRPQSRPAPFLTTRWTRVCLAKADSDDGRSALADLCDAYYEPVVAYLRSVLRDADAGRDMCHSFFAEVLSGGKIGGADPERGRFRFYLLGAVKHFVAHRIESEMRLKRGGGVRNASLDDESLQVSDDSFPTPEQAFDRQWAITVLQRAMATLENECSDREKPDLIEHIKPWLLGEAGYGDQAAAAARLGLSPQTMKALVHRMRSRFRQCVKAEVAGTLNGQASVEDEMRSLFSALGS